LTKQVRIEEKTWAAEEFAEVDFIDERLNYRCQKLAEALGQQPTASINQACEDWADSKAAYRFFENPDVSPEQILHPHSERSVERMKGYKIVLAIQDTTFFNYTHHPETQGLGEIGTKVTNQRGFGLHSTLAVAPSGQPLGMLTQAYVERPVGKAARTPEETKALPIEEKESYRWLEALEKTIQMAPEGVKVVTVCDREADIYELFALAQKLHAPLLVRATENRCLEADEAKTLWPKLEQQSIQGELSVQINGNDKRKQRQATVSIRFCSITLRPPWRPAPQKLPLITLQAIFVREDNPPKNLAELGDHEPIEWMLLTNTQVNDFEGALQVVAWYCCRWQIEVFHKIIKSGCRVENCLLQTASRLQNYITLMCIVAWRLHWLTYINRTDPDSPCTQILTTIEWQALYLRIHKSTKFPQTPPSTHQAVRWIAQLGGFLGRKSDGEPGITTIWRGWQRLQDFAATWSIIINDQPQLVGNR
jgi:hypothetical protein